MDDLTDDDFEFWMEASDEQVEREETRLNNMMAELDRRLAAMTVPQQVSHHRHFLLRDIMENRRRLRNPRLARIDIIDDMFRESVRRCQMRLLKLRIWRATGTYPGTA